MPLPSSGMLREAILLGAQENVLMKTCKTCELIARRNAGVAPRWDCIYRTSYWDVAHSYDTALLGWLVLVV